MKKPKHFISNIDMVNMMADCCVCGRMRIWKRKNRTKGVSCRNAHPRGDRQHRKTVGEKCERCNFVPENKCQLDIHHKDGNHKNDIPSNLQTLCANCHRLQGVGLLV